MRILIAALLIFSPTGNAFAAAPSCPRLFAPPKLYSNDELAIELIKNLIMVMKLDRSDKLTLIKTQITTLEILKTHVNETLQEKITLIIQILSETVRTYGDNPERFSEQLRMAHSRIEVLGR
jgi:hypothetical protein